MIVEPLLVIDLDGEDLGVWTRVERIILLLAVPKLRLEAFWATGTGDRDLQNLVLELRRWAHYPLVAGNVCVTGETLRELLLLLRASSGLIKDNNHLAHFHVICVNSAFSTHFDDFTDLVFGLANVLLGKSIVLNLDCCLRGKTFWLENGSRSRVLPLRVMLIKALAELLIVVARASIWTFFVTRRQRRPLIFLNVAHFRLLCIHLDLEGSICLLLEAGNTAVLFCGHY